MAIIGAGAAGLTAALRLVQAGAQAVIFEGSNRIGGRIFTMDGFIPPELNEGKPMFCELGGELVNSNHKDLIDLAAELGVEIQELKKGDPGVDYYFFEGKIRTGKDLVPAFEPLGKQLAQDALGLEDKEKNYTAKARKFDRMSMHDYLRAFDSKVEPWVLRMLDVAYEVEYGRATKEQSALNLITYLVPDTKGGFELYGESDESKRVKGGNSRLIEALEKAIVGKVKIHTRHKLTAIAADTKGKVRLTFDTPDGPLRFAFSKVICALPFTMLRDGRVAGIKKTRAQQGEAQGDRGTRLRHEYEGDDCIQEPHLALGCAGEQREHIHRPELPSLLGVQPRTGRAERDSDELSRRQNRRGRHAEGSFRHHACGTGQNFPGRGSRLPWIGTSNLRETIVFSQEMSSVALSLVKLLTDNVKDST